MLTMSGQSRTARCSYYMLGIGASALSGCQSLHIKGTRRKNRKFVRMSEAPHIELTEVRREDSETMYRWINEAETVRFNAPYRPVTWGEHASWFDNLGSDRARTVFALRKRDNRELIGVLQLIDVHPIHRSAELIIRIGSEADRGRGYGTQALKLAVDYAWRDLNLQRVWLRVFGSNARAISAYSKAGFEQEGTLRRAAWINGRWEDEVVMAILNTAPFSDM